MQATCTYKQGSLPGCAPLALAQIPAQQSSEPAYKSGEALSRGTLFPGLDLPFKNIVNQMPAETTEHGNTDHGNTDHGNTDHGNTDHGNTDH